MVFRARRGTMAHEDDFQRRARAQRPSRRIGKVSFDADKLLDNYITLISTLIKVKPSGAKRPVYQEVLPCPPPWALAYTSMC